MQPLEVVRILDTIKQTIACKVVCFIVSETKSRKILILRKNDSFKILFPKFLAFSCLCPFKVEQSADCRTLLL